MASKTPKFPVDKAYVKVQRDSKSTFSHRHSDLLSYSYSCVRAFSKNKHIIGDLAALHEKQEYQGSSFQPELYNLSGERNKHIIQPFYCSTLSADDQKVNYGQNYFYTKNSKTSIHFQIKSEPDFPEKNLLFQWLKYQLNSFWPFLKSTENYLTKLCKKNRKIKMEMQLNNIDEQTKSKLKKYVSNLNLNLEERHCLFNESIIEIDITPLMGDRQRLQTFLSYLANMESSLSEIVDDCDIKQPQNCEFDEHKAKFKANFFKKQINERHLLQRYKNKLNNNMLQDSSVEVLSNKRSTETLKKDNAFKTNCIAEPTDLLFNSSKKDQYRKHNEEQTRNIFDCGKKENKVTFVEKPIMNNNYSNENRKRAPVSSHLCSDKIKLTLDAEKKTCYNSTAPTKQQIYHNACQLNRNKNLVHEQNMVCSQIKKLPHQTNFLNEHDKIHSYGLQCQNVSCKCLIHSQREDYNRYRNQCLFGQGDENSNNLIKYVAVQEKKSKSKIRVSKIQPKDHLEGNNVFETYQNISQMCTENNGHGLEICTQNKQLNFNSHPYFINELKDRHDPYKNNLNKFHPKFEENYIIKNKQVRNHDGNNNVKNNKNNFCKVNVEDNEKLIRTINYSNESFSSNSKINSNCDNDKTINGNYEHVSINACFESLNYSFNLNTLKNGNNGGSISTAPLSKYNHSSTSINKFSSKKSLTTSNLNFSSVELAETSKSNATTFKMKGENSFKDKNEKQNQAKFNLENITKSNVANIFYKNKNFNIKTSTDTEFCKEIVLNDLEGKQSIINTVLRDQNKKAKVDNEGKKKIRILVRNSNKLKTPEFRKDILNRSSNIFEISSQYKRSKENILNNSRKESYKEQKQSIAEKINNDKQINTEINTLRPSKKKFKLKSFKPTNIYRSISSVFRKHPINCNLERTENKQTKIKNKISNIKINASEEEYKYISVKKKVSHSFAKHTNNGSFQVSRRSSCSSTLQRNSQLTLNNVEKLFSEVQNQREEINIMKKLLYEFVK